MVHLNDNCKDLILLTKEKDVKHFKFQVSDVSDGNFEFLLSFYT